LTPNIITFLGFIITCVGSYLVFNGNFLFGGIIIGIGIFFDSIDGTMARISGEDGDFGNLLDSVIDRVGEGVIYLSIIGFFLYKQVNETAVILCTITLLFSFMISYIRAKSESLNIENKSGFFTRVERSIILVILLIFSQPLIALYILSIGTFFSALMRLYVGLRNAKK
tara:strand:- start:25 stop:531 length:507 start_codon:yes stop_codon:yes gene_type:complete